MFNQGGASNNAKQGAGGAPGGPGNRPSGGSTPPSSSINQQAVQQQQQPHPYGYGGPGAQYAFPTPFNLVNAQAHQGHPLQHQPNPTVGGGNLNPAAGGGAAGNAAPSLIDPMLSTLSDGGEGMSDDEDHGASAGVKAGGTATGGGNNGINQHHLEDDDFQDGSQSVGGQPGGVSLGVATAVDENGQPVKKKRRRQALSCTECKRRKIKCDRQNPCSPCTRRGEADRCRWATQEPIPDAISPYTSSDKFVTRQEYDLLHQKVLQLESFIHSLVPRAFLPGLDPLNLPIPPPFPFGPPHHGGAPQHHPYAGNPGQQQPGAPQDGQFPPGAAGQAQATPEIHQLYQQHLAYAAAAAHNAQAQAAVAAASQQHADKSGEGQMEVDPHPAVQQHATGGTEHTAEGHASPPALPETTGKLIPASPSVSAKTAKGKKRKDRNEGEEGDEAHTGRGGGGTKGRGKPRSQKQAGWDTNGSPLLPQAQPPSEGGEPSTAAA